MHIIPMSTEILRKPTTEDLKIIEQAGRVCYKSESKISEYSYEQFINKIIELGHESVIEHALLTVKIVANRGVTHELVRHRLASFSQESTRYCNYSKDTFGNNITFVRPMWTYEYLHKAAYEEWLKALRSAENSYFQLLAMGLSPQHARGVLPIDVKTEIVVTANLRQWRHIFKLRTSKAAHPDIRFIATNILDSLEESVVFKNL